MSIDAIDTVRLRGNTTYVPLCFPYIDLTRSARKHISTSQNFPDSFFIFFIPAKLFSCRHLHVIERYRLLVIYLVYLFVSVSCFRWELQQINSAISAVSSCYVNLDSKTNLFWKTEIIKLLSLPCTPRGHWFVWNVPPQF